MRGAGTSTPIAELPLFDGSPLDRARMHILGTILIGLMAGIVAKLLTPGRDPGGFILTTVLGIIGAVVATYLGQAIGIYRADEAAGFIGAVVGAVIVLLAFRAFARR
jgi:uncharacterized membrane protein YeaQ/YmgE (transglycosylase-associated protein family)